MTHILQISIENRTHCQSGKRYGYQYQHLLLHNAPALSNGVQRRGDIACIPTYKYSSVDTLCALCALSFTEICQAQSSQDSYSVRIEARSELKIYTFFVLGSPKGFDAILNNGLVFGTRATNCSGLYFCSAASFAYVCTCQQLISHVAPGREHN